jgi:hypothetical protein
MKLLPFLLILAAIATGCGGSMADPAKQAAAKHADPSKQLVAITVTPASADAQNFSNGQVQFTAVGTFSDGSKAPIQALWTLNGPFTQTPIADISLSSTGLGQCVAGGFVGTSGVFATAPANPALPLSQMTMFTKNVLGTAQITCP